MLVKHFKQAVIFVGLFLALSIYVLHVRSHTGASIGLSAWARRHRSVFQQVLEDTPSPAFTASEEATTANTDDSDFDDDANAPQYIDDEDDKAFFALKEPQADDKSTKQKDVETSKETSGKTASKVDSKSNSKSSSKSSSKADSKSSSKTDSKSSGKSSSKTTLDTDEDEEDSEEYTSAITTTTDHREIFSLTMANRKFFPIFFGGMAIYNPNIIPHPTRADLWIVVAQREQAGEEFHHSEQVTCAAGFLNDVLTCTQEPTVLPLEPSINGKCEGDLAYHNFRPGPRDGRVFMTPGGPMIMYGSQSQYSCLGIWTQDLRTLSPELVVESALPQIFRGATEVQRPAPVGPIQKNFFFFFDSMNKAYIHHDIYPKRVFAEINFDGSVGEDIAPAAYAHDEMCLAQYMPSVAKEWESIHQATNSLAITLCQRADPGCQPNDNNTLIMSFMQHKKFHDFHGEYEPYLFLFKQTAPFELYAISRRPIWIAGRGPLTKETHSLLFDFYQKGREIPKGHSEMFYVTSMSWKTHGQKYHGYIDDPLFLNFGIEDTRAGAIDILAGDLVQDLGLCGDMGSSRI